MRASSGSGRGRRLVVGLSVAGAMLLMLGLWQWQSRVTLHANPLRNIPSTAVGVVHLRWPQVRSSALWSDVVVARGGDRALRALEAECGFDWSEGLHTLTAFADAEPDGSERMVPEHVGFILTGPLELERMVACLAPADGAALEERDVEGVRSYWGGGEYHAALLDDGAVLVGHVDALRAAIRTIRGDAPSLGDLTDVHTAYEIVSGGRHVSALVRLDSRWRGALEEALQRASSDGNPSSDRPFGGPSAPVFIAAGARVERGLTFGAVAHFDTEADARDFERAVDSLRSDWGARLAVSLSPVGPALRSIATQTEGLDLTLAFDLDARRVAELAEAFDAQNPR